MADTTLPGLLATGDHASRPAASAVGTGALYSCTTHGLVYQSDGSAWATWATLGAAAIPSTIVAGWDAGTAALTTADMADIDVILPDAGTIVAAYVVADPAGSGVVDVWVDDSASHPPTDLDSITASAPPTISSATISHDTTLTGWTTAFAAGDVFRFHPDSVATAHRLTVTLVYERS